MARTRKKSGRSRKEMAETKQAYSRILTIIKTESERPGADGEVNSVLMQWLDEVRVKAEQVMLKDHLNS